MLQIIGVMIGLYIFTRMGELIESKGPSLLTKISAVITGIAAILGVIGLIVAGERLPTNF